jgi:hypothetical protein
MDVPRLRTSSWQAALDDAVPQLTQFQERLDAISEDIRTLEKVLIDSGFRLYATVYLDNGIERIAWMELGKNNWRICLLEPTEDGDNWAAKPLIETPAADRWQAASSIPRFLTEIASTARLAPAVKTEASPSPPDDDVPF